MNVVCSDDECPILLNSECVFYEGSSLPATGISTNDDLQTVIQKLNTAIANSGGGGDAIWGDITGTLTDQTDLITYLSGTYLTLAGAASTYTPLARTLTINGVAQTLAADRTWTIIPGHVIENSGTPLTQRDNLNFTNGLTAVDGAPDTIVKLGGTLTENTFISGGNFVFSLSGANGVALSASGTGTKILSISNSILGSLVFSQSLNEIRLTDVRGTPKGIEYAADYSVTYTNRSLVDKAYVDAIAGGISGLTTNRIPYATSATTLGDDSALTWNDTNKVLTIGAARIFSPSGVLENLFIGNSAGNFTLDGAGASFNIGIGRLTLNATTTGSQNVAIGPNAGQSITNGSNNVLLGNLAGGLLTASNNILIGYRAGDALTSGSNNLVIGFDIDAQSATASNQLSLANSIFGLGNSSTGTTVSTGIISHYSIAAIGSWSKATFINNIAAEGTAIANGIVLYGKDSSDGATNSTFAMYCEQAPEATATFTQTHRMKVWINGTEYWWSLDAV